MSVMTAARASEAPQSVFASSAQLASDKFEVKRTSAFCPAAVADVLDGTSLGTICGGFSCEADRRTICENFWSHPARYSRGADAPAEYLGSYHYGKTTDEYLDDVETSAVTIDRVFAGASDPVERFRNGLHKELCLRSRLMRPARFKGREACSFVMRSWKGSTSFALAPHEDEAQCHDPRQKGFEIQAAAGSNPLAAVNICLQNGAGGTLRIWNMRPDDHARRSLGLQTTGSPYPLAFLEGVASIDVPIQPGDLYVFDGRFLHAVTGLAASGPTVGQRATIAFLMAHLDRDQTIHWT